MSASVKVPLTVCPVVEVMDTPEASALMSVPFWYRLTVIVGLPLLEPLRASTATVWVALGVRGWLVSAIDQRDVALVAALVTPAQVPVVEPTAFVGLVKLPVMCASA